MSSAQPPNRSPQPPQRPRPDRSWPCILWPLVDDQKSVSWNSIRFADGRIAEPPIATCELQGYAYDARRRAARLARLVWDDAALADRLEHDAAALRERFDRAEARLPVEYPTACQPQAWAAGTPLLAVRTLLGLDVVGGRLRADPHLPEGIARLELDRVPVPGGHRNARGGG
jgi:glycogen debranching enzyme